MQLSPFYHHPDLNNKGCRRLKADKTSRLGASPPNLNLSDKDPGSLESGPKSCWLLSCAVPCPPSCVLWWPQPPSCPASCGGPGRAAVLPARPPCSLSQAHSASGWNSHPTSEFLQPPGEKGQSPSGGTLRQGGYGFSKGRTNQRAHEDELDPSPGVRPKSELWGHGSEGWCLLSATAWGHGREGWCPLSATACPWH